MKGNHAHRLVQLLIISVGLSSIISCSDSSDLPASQPTPLSCSDEDYNQFVYDSMKRLYYWYDEVDPFNQINPKDTTAFPTPQHLLDVLKYSTLDRFSNISNAAALSQFYGEGIFLGTGLRLLVEEQTGNIMVSYAYINGDAYTQGIRRGDRIVSINGQTANGLYGSDWTNAWGVNEVGTDVVLQIDKPNGTTTSVTVTKTEVSIVTTQNSKTITSGQTKIGYLHFTNFLGTTSVDDLNEQFIQFSNDNISELIVDLRYNGGGSVSTAQYLASLIGGAKTSGSIFAKLVFNNKKDGYNGRTENFSFYNPAYSLNLSRVIFITTGSSCSASELVINALIPNQDIDVIVVGSSSCGKPVGSIPQSYCKKSLSIIDFEIKNSQNQGGYFDGIGAGYNGLSDFCNASDDLSFALGDNNESSVSSALAYINNGQCSVSQLKSGTRMSNVNRTTEEVQHELSDLY